VPGSGSGPFDESFADCGYLRWRIVVIHWGVADEHVDHAVHIADVRDVVVAYARRC
jgi:hypothetical protein